MAEIGKRVWIWDPYGNMHDGLVTQKKSDDSGNCYIVITGGFTAREEAFPSYDECVLWWEAKRRETIDKYLEEIKSVEDLVQFMYSHCCARCEEYTDWEAREAVRVRALELLGVNLRED